MAMNRALCVSDVSGFAVNIVTRVSLIVVCLTAFGLNAQTVGVQCLNSKVFGFDNVPGFVNDAVLRGETLFVSTGAAGFAIYDISNTASPVMVEQYEVPGLSIEVSGQLAIVGGGLAGVFIFDILNTSDPVLLSSYDTPGSARRVRVINDVMFVADTSGVVSIDISNPASPELLSSVPTDGVIDFAIRENTMFIGGSLGFYTIDISDPSAISQISYEPLLINGGTPFDLNGESIVVYEDVALLISGLSTGTLRSVDISDIKNPVFGSLFSTGVNGPAVSLFVDEEILYISYPDIVHAFDIRDTLDPILMAGFPIHGGTWGRMDVAGDDLIAASDGFSIIDISDLRPTFISVYDIKQTRRVNADSVRVVDGVAYLTYNSTRGPSGLELINISDATKPVRLGHHETGTSVSDVFVSGDHAILAYENDGLEVVDISDSTLPTKVASIQTPGDAHRIVVEENIAFVADSYAGLTVVDISNPEVLKHISTYDTPGWARNVQIDGGLAYVADNSSLQILDISNPMEIVAVGSYPTNSSWGLVVDWPFVYMPSYLEEPHYADGLLVLDVSDPTNPFEVGSLDTGFFHGLTIDGDTLYIANHNALLLVDVSDPSSPHSIGIQKTPADAEDVTVVDGVAFVPTWGGTAYHPYGAMYLIDVSTGCDVTCPADTNNDGSLTPADFTAWIAAFNAGAPECDQNGDGSCTPADFTAWTANFNAGCP